MMALAVAHARATLTELVRSPGYWVPTLLFPAMLYSFFGANIGGLTAKFVVASFAVYAVAGVGFYQFGVGIAQDRASPWDAYVRTLPAGPGPRIAAQVLAALVFAVAAAALVLVTAGVLAGLSLAPAALASLIFVLLAGVVPFALLGVALGYLADARGAVAVANLVYLPLAFAGGLWLPPRALPDAVARISPYTPTRQLGELAWSAVRGAPPPAFAVIGLAAWTLAFAGLAWWAYRRAEIRQYR